MPDFLIPCALVMATALLLPRRWLSGSTRHPVAVWVVMAGTGLVIARYLSWRLTSALPAADTSIGEWLFCWALFWLEMTIWFDTAILFLTLTRRRDNSAAASRGETRLRAAKASELPSVDVLIATFNEGFDIIEKTLAGALEIDWPKDRLRICVLDDGKRDWLAEYCARKGVDYFTRDSNAHAKAGNINAAINRTDGEFFMVLDADFIPQQNFLYRAMGLFEDEKVRVVQIPHSFYNADPMQTNLGLRDAMPDDQRFFFDVIMPSRDGWDAAFCCGSNSITRRSAIESIGGGLPTGSLTEDMLLTLALLRKGFVTRYLKEHLAIGLAPESLAAMYVQRARWARGAIQMLYLRDGPLGPGLKLTQRLMFLPLHWVIQPLLVVVTLSTPLVCLWTGWSPLPMASAADVIGFQFPALMATVLTLRLIAPGAFFPLAAIVHNALQAPRIIPTVLSTLIKPHGHAFEVTPKGDAAQGQGVDRVMVFVPAAMIFATAFGLFLNADIDTRILLHQEQIPLLAFWAVVSMVILSVIQAVAVSSEKRRSEESFDVDTPCRVASRPGPGSAGRIETISLTEARIRTEAEDIVAQHERWLRVDIPEIGSVAAFVRRQNGRTIDLALLLPQGERRDALLRKLFTSGMDNSTHTKSALRIFVQMVLRIAFGTRLAPALRASGEAPPVWLSDEIAAPDRETVIDSGCEKSSRQIP